MSSVHSSHSLPTTRCWPMPIHKEKDGKDSVSVRYHHQQKNQVVRILLDCFDIRLLPLDASSSSCADYDSTHRITPKRPTFPLFAESTRRSIQGECRHHLFSHSQDWRIDAQAQLGIKPHNRKRELGISLGCRCKKMGKKNCTPAQ